MGQSVVQQNRMTRAALFGEHLTHLSRKMYQLFGKRADFGKVPGRDYKWPVKRVVTMISSGWLAVTSDLWRHTPAAECNHWEWLDIFKSTLRFISTERHPEDCCFAATAVHHLYMNGFNFNIEGKILCTSFLMQSTFFGLTEVNIFKKFMISDWTQFSASLFASAYIQSDVRDREADA